MSSDDVQKIKDRLGIIEVVEQYITLQKAGKHLKANCPFHNEKTPSFVVSPERDTFYCFGCGKKGDIFTFVQEYEGLEFRETLELLAEKAGVTLSQQPSSAPKNKYDTEKKILDTAAALFEQQLRSQQQAQEYLKQRGCTDEIIAQWRIGFAPDGWHALQDHMKTVMSDVTPQQLETVGLIKKGDKGDWYDRFRNRIMFPIADVQGQIVAFTGRYFGDDDRQAKYLNSPETPLFNKSSILYGYHLAKGAIRKLDFSILVEGQFDVIAAHAMGYTNTIATSGTAITEQQLQLLSRLSKRLVVALDADGAGVKAAERAWKMALSMGIDVKIARLPDGADPADLFTNGKQDIWKDAVKNAMHVIDFLARHIQERESDKRKMLLAVHEELVPYIQSLESSVEQSYFTEQVALRFGITRDALWTEVAKAPPVSHEKQHVQVRHTSSASTGQQTALQGLLRQLAIVLVWQSSQEKPAVSLESIANHFEAHQLERIQAVMDVVRQEDEEQLFFADELYQNDDHIQRVVDELVNRILITALRDRRMVIQSHIEQQEASGDQEKVTELLQQLHDVTQKISALEKQN